MAKKTVSVEFIQQELLNILNSYQLDENTIAAVIDSFSQDKVSAFRVNTLKQDIATTLAMLDSYEISYMPVAWSECSFICADKERLTRIHEARDGLFYIQNLSSQLTVVAMKPQADNFILDLAAAPGGKTGFIAQLMNNQGKISAVEPVKDRYYRLIANLRSLGVSIARCYHKDGRIVGKLCTEWFDQVLLDAPCSSMAQIDFRDEESYQHWNLKKVKECSRKQKQLIESAFMSLKSGCQMIYSTCSWMVEENEEVVNHLLNMYPNQVEVLPIELPIDNYLNGLTSYQDKQFNDSLSNTKRIVPNNQFEAFYIARIRKLA